MKETPSQLNIPSYLMNFPFTLSTENPNNIWMGLQLPHIKDRNVMLLSNYTSEPRRGEEWVGKRFFDMMGYETFVCPHKWEGEADLKYLKDNIYIGGYGQRSILEAYEWMEKNFDMKIIKLNMVEPYLYHLDCSVFPLTNEKTMICTSLYDENELKELKKYTKIIDISEDDAFGGITNSVRLGNMVLCASNISELKKGEELYELEKTKINNLEKICGDEGMEPIIFNLSEFMKSGALLSCMVQHLNRVDINKKLI